ncbi:putative kinesin light protein, partial [Diplogelasinospora grovesii]
RALTGPRPHAELPSTNHPHNGLQSTRRDLTHDDYIVGWVCALAKETIAAVAMLDETHEPPKPRGDQDVERDQNTYHLGSICGHNVVIAWLPEGEIGTNSAAVTATQMMETFPSRLCRGVGRGRAGAGKFSVHYGLIASAKISRVKFLCVEMEAGRGLMNNFSMCCVIRGYLRLTPTRTRTRIGRNMQQPWRPRMAKELLAHVRPSTIKREPLARDVLSLEGSYASSGGGGGQH